MSPSERLEAVTQRLESACRDAGRPRDEVTLVAVSKRQPDVGIQALYDLGHRDFGENLVQPWIGRLETLDLPEARWHLIGGLQTRKAREVAEHRPALLHTVDRVGLVEALSRRLGSGPSLEVLLQVNVDREPQKWGCTPEEVDQLADAICGAERLRLRGLMCIPRPIEGAPPRAAFAQTRTLLEGISDRLSGAPVLSMGMSADFTEAIAEGSTLVRVGTALFGPRADPT